MKLLVYFVFSLLLCQAAKVFGLRYDFGDGRFYVGNVDEYGKPSGRGQFFNSSGALEYDGDFINGLPHGNGIRYGADGSVFSGQFRNGHSEGPGNLTLMNGDRFEGDFFELMPHGRATLTKNNSFQDEANHLQSVTRVDGEFRFGMPHGFVIVTYGDQDLDKLRIEGTFKMGKPHGHARVIDLSNNSQVIYDGKFLNGHPVETNRDPNVDLIFKKIQLQI